MASPKEFENCIEDGLKRKRSAECYLLNIKNAMISSIWLEMQGLKPTSPITIGPTWVSINKDHDNCDDEVLFTDDDCTDISAVAVRADDRFVYVIDDRGNEYRLASFGVLTVQFIYGLFANAVESLKASRLENSQE